VRRGRPARPGVALVLALASILVLTCLVQWSLLHALSGIRRVEAQRSVLQRALARASARARLSALLDTTALGTLTGGPVTLSGDTTVTVTAQADGWVRVALHAAGTEFSAELAHTRPWPGPCAAATVSRPPTASPAAIRADSIGQCVALHLTQRASTDSVQARWEEAIVPPRPPLDTLRLTAALTGHPRLYWARAVIHIDGGAVVRGLVVAPVVHVAAGARVEGSVLAAERLEVGLSGVVVADPGAALAGWSTAARIQRLGRRGLLAFP
jgi:hypothetical protein